MDHLIASRRILCIFVVLFAVSLVHAADKTPPPKHVELDKYKRGYTVYIPAGIEAGKTYPAIIWLHPLSGSMNIAFRKDWWDDLNRHKVFMVFPESADAAKWTEAADYPYLVDLAADLPVQFPINRQKLVLFGHEAGGIVAFDMVRKYPDRFASLIAMATYPRPDIVSFPPDSARRTLSVLMVVGTADKLRDRVREAVDMLDSKGFTAGIIEVPDATQAYLPAAKPQVLAWLDKISAGERPVVVLPEPERLARQALADSARKKFAEILQSTSEPNPEGSSLIKLPDAGVTVNMPPGWKVLGDKFTGARLTTVAIPDGPLLVQIAVERGPTGLDRAIKDHEALNRTRGVRYITLQTSPFKLGDQSWTLQQATCLSYHTQITADAKTRVVDVPSMVTVCYLPLDPKASRYLRIVFLYTDTTVAKIDLPHLVRQVLSSVRALPAPVPGKPVVK